MDSFPHFKKSYQHKMVPFLPLKVLCLEKMLGAAVAILLPTWGGGGPETGRVKRRLEKHRGVKLGPRWSLLGAVLPLTFFLRGLIHFIIV